MLHGITKDLQQPYQVSCANNAVVISQNRNNGNERAVQGGGRYSALSRKGGTAVVQPWIFFKNFKCHRLHLILMR